MTIHVEEIKKAPKGALSIFKKLIMIQAVALVLFLLYLY